MNQVLIKLIHDWLCGELIELNGEKFVFPHGQKQIRKLLEGEL